jgi:aspartate/methionine/tyrosine aminotransferase
MAAAIRHFAAVFEGADVPGTTASASSPISYAAWVRGTITHVRQGDRRIVPLFESSVPEPCDLLADVVQQAFTPPISDRYASAFAGGNPYVVAQLARSYGVDPVHLLCTTGATGALSLIYRALVRPRERILVETPGFDLFGGIADELGISVDHFSRAGDRFEIDVAAVEARLHPLTRLIVISNLHNPSGHAVPHSTMQALAAMAERRGVILVVDEVYGDYADAATRPLPAARLSPACISVSSLTKIFGLSTLRCGWIVADPAVIDPIRALSERVEFGISNLAHAIAATVLEGPGPFVAHADAVIAAARPIIERYWRAWTADGLIAGALPPFGCIAFPRLPGIMDTTEFADQLAAETGVLVAPGEYFGAPGHVRIGFALPTPALERGLAALDLALRAARTSVRAIA